MLGHQQRGLGAHELLHAIKAQQSLLGEFVGGFGVVEQQAGGFHQPCTNLQARIGRVFLGHSTQRGVDFQSGPRVQAPFAALADQGVSQAKIALGVFEARLRTLGHGLAIGLGSRVEIFVGHGQLTQQRLPAHRQR
ncbi:hypothetical protein D3C72_1949900 [compost metagenome]